MQKNQFIYFNLLLSIIISGSLYSQDTTTSQAVKIAPVVKEHIRLTKWSVKAGANISVIYLARNVKESNNNTGFCGGITYELNNFIRVATLYSRFRPIDIEPTWLNVNASTYEMNLEMLAKFPNKKTLLYPFFGLSYNTFSGFFTGEADYLNLVNHYPANSLVKNKWLGFNLGAGVEHNFGLIGIFVDYRMRLGKQDNAFNIMDVCYTGGLKIIIPNLKRKIIYPAQNSRFLD